MTALLNTILKLIVLHAKMQKINIFHLLFRLIYAFKKLSDFDVRTFMPEYDFLLL